VPNAYSISYSSMKSCLHCCTGAAEWQQWVTCGLFRWWTVAPQACSKMVDPQETGEQFSVKNSEETGLSSNKAHLLFITCHTTNYTTLLNPRIFFQACLHRYLYPALCGFICMYIILSPRGPLRASAEGGGAPRGGCPCWSTSDWWRGRLKQPLS
jgi:hypothetical protein